MKVITTLLTIYLIITAMSIILSIAEAIRQVAYELDNEENKIKEDDFFDIFLRSRTQQVSYTTKSAGWAGAWKAVKTPPKITRRVYEVHRQPLCIYTEDVAYFRKPCYTDMS